MAEQRGVEFKLFAPYNESVKLAGSWNDWQPQDMTRGDDGWWRASVPLEDGEHPYKFDVVSKSFFAEGETLRVADPRALRITEDADENSVVVVKNGQRVDVEYDWQHNDVPLPQNHELVIYEMHIGDFSGGPGDDQEGPKGRFADAIEKLDYLAELGINAVELMPVNEYPGSYSWGYNPRSLFAVENGYGTPEDLCRFVDECHARGIRVLYDGVFNHTDGEAPLTKIDYTYWYHGQNNDPAEMQWGAKFNIEFCDEALGIWPARQHIRDAIILWLDLFHFDGIRFDATRAIRSFDFMGWLQAEIYNHIDGLKPFITIAEHVPEDPAITGPDGPFDAAWNESFSKQLMSTISTQEQDGRQPFNLDAVAGVLDPRHEGYANAANVIHYIDNHDQDRIMWQLGEANFIDDPAFRRMEMGAALLLTAPGIPLLWMGQEFGESAPRMLERQPIDWSLLQNGRNAQLHDRYKYLIDLRTHAPALQGDAFEIIHQDGERGVFVFKRWDDGGSVIVVVANIEDKHQGAVEIGNWPGDGMWHEYTHNYDVDVQGGVMRDQLAESEVKIYLKK